MRNAILKKGKYLVIIIITIAFAWLLVKYYRLEEKVLACQALLQRVFLDKPEYYLDTLSKTDEYYKYYGVFNYKEPPIDN